MKVCLFVLVLLTTGGLIYRIFKQSPILRKELLDHFEVFGCFAFFLSCFGIGMLGGYYGVSFNKVGGHEFLD